MRISVFGIGYVGAVSAGCLGGFGHNVVAVDTNSQKVELINAGLSPIVEPGLDALISSAVADQRLRATTDAADAVSTTELSLVCVGTPSLPSGDVDLSYIKRVSEQIGLALRDKDDFHLVVMRSTMPPGSTDNVVMPLLEQSSGKRAGEDFGLAVCPEFLREGSAIQDYREAANLVVGMHDERTLAELNRLNGHLGGKLLPTQPAVAEMLKYASNAWHAAKIVFANEIGVLSKALGIDGRAVMEMLCADRRLNISPAYMRPGFAFGGSCLPKDLRALTYKAKRLDVNCQMLDALLPSNELQIRRAFDLVCATGNRRVGLIGLSFKHGTDDLRESPAVELAERLFGKGYDIRIFDRNISLARVTGANRAFIESRIPHLAALLADDLQEVAQHGDTLVMAHQQLDEHMLPPLRGHQVLIDLACLVDGTSRPGGTRGFTETRA